MNQFKFIRSSLPILLTLSLTQLLSAGRDKDPTTAGLKQQVKEAVDRCYGYAADPSSSNAFDNTNDAVRSIRLRTRFYVIYLATIHSSKNEPGQVSSRLPDHQTAALNVELNRSKYVGVATPQTKKEFCSLYKKFLGKLR